MQVNIREATIDDAPAIASYQVTIIGNADPLKHTR